jgi:UDP-N-acetylglucosamine 2-epimerase
MCLDDRAIGPMVRTICVATGSRSEFGLLRWVMTSTSQDPELTLRLPVTGMHLSPAFNRTYRKIEAAELLIDSPRGTCRSTRTLAVSSLRWDICGT